MQQLHDFSKILSYPFWNPLLNPGGIQVRCMITYRLSWALTCHFWTKPKSSSLPSSHGPMNSLVSPLPHLVSGLDFSCRGPKNSSSLLPGGKKNLRKESDSSQATSPSNLMAELRSQYKLHCFTLKTPYSRLQKTSCHMQEPGREIPKRWISLLTFRILCSLSRLIFEKICSNYILQSIPSG